jgi:hypothetical protein
VSDQCSREWAAELGTAQIAALRGATRDRPGRPVPDTGLAGAACLTYGATGRSQATKGLRAAFLPPGGPQRRRVRHEHRNAAHRQNVDGPPSQRTCARVVSWTALRLDRCVTRRCSLEWKYPNDFRRKPPQGYFYLAAAMSGPRGENAPRRVYPTDRHGSMLEWPTRQHAGRSRADMPKPSSVTCRSSAFGSWYPTLPSTRGGQQGCRQEATASSWIVRSSTGY